MQVNEAEEKLSGISKRILTWVLIVGAVVLLNTCVQTLFRLDSCTPEFGYGVPMGGGECQGFIESKLGLTGFIAVVWFILIGWPGANVVLGLYLSRELKVARLLVFPTIVVVGLGTISALRYFYPMIVPD